MLTFLLIGWALSLVSVAGIIIWGVVEVLRDPALDILLDRMSKVPSTNRKYFLLVPYVGAGLACRLVYYCIKSDKGVGMIETMYDKVFDA